MIVDQPEWMNFKVVEDGAIVHLLFLDEAGLVVAVLSLPTPLAGPLGNKLTEIHQRYRTILDAQVKVLKAK